MGRRALCRPRCGVFGSSVWVVALVLAAVGPSWPTTTALADRLPRAQATLVVTSTGDNGGIDRAVGAGSGTLRQAIVDANAGGGAHGISFALPGSGPHVITLLRPLPELVSPIDLNGYTQPGSRVNTLSQGSNAVLPVVVSGARLRDTDPLLIVRSDDTRIRGLALTSVYGAGIFIAGVSAGVQVSGAQITLGIRPLSQPPNSPTGFVLDPTARAVLIGGAVPAERNIISGAGAFRSTGLLVEGNANRVEGNVIGRDPNFVPSFTGGSVSTLDTGILVTGAGNLIGGATPGAGNVVSGNDARGVDLFGDDNRVQGNIIGPDPGLTALLGSQSIGVYVTGRNNVVGGSTPAARNYVLGHSAGIGVQSTGAVGNVVRGNYVGVDATGTRAVSGGFVGISIDGDFLGGATGPGNTIGGPRPEDGNVIGGQFSDGLTITNRSNNTVQNNRIGTTADGAGALSNGGAGISIRGDSPPSSHNMIGGETPGLGNIVAFNNRGGVVVENTTGTGNSILGNAIFGNGNPGIDLGLPGPTPNDAGDLDIGPNDLQNFPVLNQVGVSGTTTIIFGVLNSLAGRVYRLEFFATSVGDGAGAGRGQTFLGAAAVTTGPDGNGVFVAILPVPAMPGQLVSATATDANGSTSEFSAMTPVAAPVRTPTPVIPEPPPWLLFGSGVALLLGCRFVDRRRRRRGGSFPQASAHDARPGRAQAAPARHRRPPREDCPELHPGEER